MRDSRANICAALMSDGGQNLESIANETLTRAGAGPGENPRRIVVRLDYHLHTLTNASDLPSPARALVSGQIIAALWDADPGEWGLNVFIGLARAEMRGRTRSQADVFRLAGHLALPGLDRFQVAPPTNHLPQWFVQAHRRRAWAGTESGVWQAVSRIAK